MTVIYRPQSSVKSSVKTVDKTVDKSVDKGDEGSKLIDTVAMI